jgi:hypothetical protein
MTATAARIRRRKTVRRMEVNVPHNHDLGLE